MKNLRIIIVLLIACCVTTDVFSQSREKQKRWDRANEYMDSRRYNAAIEIFEELKSDPAFQKDCEIRIAEAKRKMAYLRFGTPKGEVSENQPLRAGFGVVDTILAIKTNYAWRIEDFSEGIKVEKKGKNGLRILIQDENKALEDKIEHVTISAGDAPNRVEREIRIVQKGHPAYLWCSSDSLFFSASEFLKDSITIHTNTRWKVESYNDEWCSVDYGADNIKISVKENNTTQNRRNQIIVNSVLDPQLNIIVDINQTAGETELEVSKRNLYVTADECVEYVRVMSNSQWTADLPDWVAMERIANSDSVRISFLENRTGVEREAYMNIKAGDKTVSIRLKQETKPFLPPERKMLGGRDVSFGLMAGYASPFVRSMSSGTYTGSVINYSLGDRGENVNYSSERGLDISAVLDLRVYKNWYVKTEVDYTHVQYVNSFNAEVERIFNQSFNTVYKGVFQNSFKEKYRFDFINIPILASHRLVFNKWNNLQIDFGPVVGFAVSGKMAFEGNSNSDDVYPHAIVNYNEIGPVLGNRSSEYMRYAGEMNLFGTKVTNTTTSSTGGMSKDYLNEYSALAAPYQRANLGLRIGGTYEYLGFQLGVVYTHMLVNMANDNFWNSRRLPLFGQTSDVLMAGYKHRISMLEFRIGYIFRYKK